MYGWCCTDIFVLSCPCLSIYVLGLVCCSWFFLSPILSFLSFIFHVHMAGIVCTILFGLCVSMLSKKNIIFSFVSVHICAWSFNVVLVSSYRLCCLSFPFSCVFGCFEGWRILINWLYLFKTCGGVVVSSYLLIILTLEVSWPLPHAVPDFVLLFMFCAFCSIFLVIWMMWSLPTMSGNKLWLIGN